MNVGYLSASAGEAICWIDILSLHLRPGIYTLAAEICLCRGRMVMRQGNLDVS